MVFLVTQNASASRFTPISYSELLSRSSHVVIGTVTHVKELSKEEHTGIQLATIKAHKLIKGSGPEKEFKFRLRYKGLKDFDPKLTKGDSGVFFLTKAKDGVFLAFHGSVALFSKKNFTSQN